MPFIPFEIGPVLLGGILFVSSVSACVLACYGGPYAIFAYNCFFKPIAGSSPEKGSAGGQQDALESFYKGQAAIYDSTRAILLRGREEMLALAAAQLRLKNKREGFRRRVWVDVRCPQEQYCIFFVAPGPSPSAELTGSDRRRHRLEHRAARQAHLGPGQLFRRLPRRFLAQPVRRGARTLREARLAERPHPLHGCAVIPPGHRKRDGRTEGGLDHHELLSEHDPGVRIHPTWRCERVCGSTDRASATTYIATTP